MKSLWEKIHYRTYCYSRGKFACDIQKTSIDRIEWDVCGLMVDGILRPLRLGVELSRVMIMDLLLGDDL